LRAGNTQTLFSFAATIPDIGRIAPNCALRTSPLRRRVPALSASIVGDDGKASDPVANVARATRE
jgi:hypothetical protein